MAELSTAIFLPSTESRMVFVSYNIYVHLNLVNR